MVYRIGVPTGATAESVVSVLNAPDERLRELGYVEGRNVVDARRYADGTMEQLQNTSK